MANTTFTEIMKQDLRKYFYTIYKETNSLHFNSFFGSELNNNEKSRNDLSDIIEYIWDNNIKI